MDRGLLFRCTVPFLSLCAIVLLVVLPFAQPGLPVTSDGSLHLLRTVELDALLHQGYLYPRWASDLWLGLGYPLFNYYSPFFYYLSEAMRLLGVGLVGGVKLAVVLGLVVGVVSTYLLARQFLGRTGSIVAAASFALIPHALRELYRGGDYPQLLALGLLPLTLWSLHLLLPPGDTPTRRPRRGSSSIPAGPIGSPWGLPSPRRFLPLILSLAALILTHNVSVMLFGPVIAVYALFLALSSKDRRVIVWMATAALLAFGLASFFWLPAIAEKGYTQVNNLLSGYFDFRSHFLDLGQLLSASAETDSSAMNPPVVLNIGQANVVLALVSLIGLWPGLGMSRTARVRLALFLLVDLVAVLLMLQISQPVWEALPLLALAQFPSRLLGVVGLFTALLAGLGVDLIGRVWSRAGAVYGSLALLAIVYTSLPPLYPPEPFDWLTDPTTVDITRYEVRTDALGTSSAGEFMPRWTELRPSDSPLTDAYLNGGKVERLDRGPLPPGVTARTEAHLPYLEKVSFDAPGGFGALFNVFYFPGWNAYVDGKAAVSKPFPPRAMTIVDVPAGRHTVELRFEDTPIRTQSTVLSLVFVLLTAGVVGLGFRSRVRLAPVPVLAPASSQGELRSVPAQEDKEPVASNADSDMSPGAGWLLGLLVVVLVAKTGFIDPFTDLFRKSSHLPNVVNMAHSLRWEFANGMLLLGYDLNTVKVAPGGTLDLALYWQAARPLTRDYSVFAHLTPMNSEEQIAQADSMHPGPNPTSRWQPNAYALDRHPIEIPPSVPPGRYQLQIGVYDAGAKQRIPLLSTGAERSSIPLVDIEVAR